MPWEFKLDHLQPLEPILSSNFVQLNNFIDPFFSFSNLVSSVYTIYRSPVSVAAGNQMLFPLFPSFTMFAVHTHSSNIEKLCPLFLLFTLFTVNVTNSSNIHAPPNLVSTISLVTCVYTPLSKVIYYLPISSPHKPCFHC